MKANTEGGNGSMENLKRNLEKEAIVEAKGREILMWEYIVMLQSAT